MERKAFESYVTRIYNDYRVVIITNETDDFGNRYSVENLITINHAKEILENLKHTIEEYERTSI